MTVEELEAQRAAIPDDGQLPASTTNAEQRVIQARRADLDGRLTRARAAIGELAALGTTSDDERWLGELTAWRATLCTELLTFTAPLRDKFQLGRARNLECSIDHVDRGATKRMTDLGYALETLVLGDLMRAAGYQQTGADPQRNFVGHLPWRGSIKDVERRLQDHEKRRAVAEAALAEALMDDDMRQQRAAEAKQLGDAFNSLRVKQSGDPSAPGLVVVNATGDVVDEAALTPLQRRALARARAVWFAEKRESASVAT